MLETTNVVLKITEEAQAKLREILQERNQPGLSLRVFAQGAGGNTARFGMALDGEQLADDAVVEYEGFNVLVDRESAQFVTESEIDFQDGLMGAGFTLQNPNYVQASGGCGCGGNCACGGH